MLTVEQYAKLFDYALLAPNLQEADIQKGCETAIKYNFAAFCVNSCWAELVCNKLNSTDVMAAITIGYPLGAILSKVKFTEIEECLKFGVKGIDMVINIGALKDKNYKLVRNEIREEVKMCKGHALSKVICEINFLTDDEIIAITKICCEEEANYVKTSTGMSNFAKYAQIKIMCKALEEQTKTKLKVSGLHEQFDLAGSLQVIQMGATLLGTKFAPRLVEEYKEYVKNGKF